MSKKQYKLTCQICGQCDIVTHASHLKYIHQTTTQDYYDKFLKHKGEGLCKVCNSQTTWTWRVALGYWNSCSKYCASRFRLGKPSRPQSFETKEKIRQKRLIYCQTEAGKNHNNKLSADRRDWIILLTNKQRKQEKELEKLVQKEWSLKLKMGTYLP